MKFEITRDNLQQGLAAVGASIPTRTTLPVLSNILVEADSEGVRLSGTDLDIAVSLRVPADVEEPGTLTVPAKKLQELARELPALPAKVSGKAERLELRCGRAVFRINGLPSEEFPAFPSVDFERSWKIKGKVLRSLIHRTAFAVSTEESRPILNGVLWQLGRADMKMVATNGHRLARMTVPVEVATGEAVDLIVPPKALSQVDRIFSSDADIEVARSQNHLGFRDGGRQVFTRLIEGPYPDYEQVIPKDNDKAATTEKAPFLQVLRRMAVVASEQTHRVRLNFAGDIVRFSVETPDLGDASEELEVHYEGEPLEIGFNANYLLEVLKYMPTDDIRMELKAPESAVIIQPAADPSEVTGDYLCLVMPLRLVE